MKLNQVSRNLDRLSFSLFYNNSESLCIISALSSFGNRADTTFVPADGACVLSLSLCLNCQTHLKGHQNPDMSIRVRLCSAVSEIKQPVIIQSTKGFT